MIKYTIDFRNVKYYVETHQIIKKALDFPDYYGENWGAFWDCITDKVWEDLLIEIYGLDVVERLFSGFAKDLVFLLKEFKHYDNDAYVNSKRIEIVDGDKRIEIQ